MTLTATTSASSGTQTATGSPQQAPVANDGLSAGQQGSAVQPGTPENALSSQGGLPLTNLPLKTISLAPASQSTTQAATPPHHTNPIMLTASVLLFLVALTLFWAASRPDKNTTVS